jgi:hypothetical protein
MTGGEAADITKKRVTQHLVFRQSHGATRRDRHAVQANALRVGAQRVDPRCEVGVGRTSVE